MNKMNAVVKGAVTGLAVGAATYMMSNAKQHRKRTMKKRAEHAVKAMGAAVNDFTYLLK